jgi:hypothetical protein
MFDPFVDLPFNTQKSYIECVTASGCMIYIPTKSDDTRYMEHKVKLYQKYIDDYFNALPPDTLNAG